MPLPTAPIAAGSLICASLPARGPGVRPLGGVVLAAGGAVCAREWRRKAGTPASAALLAVYLGGFGASHPLAKKIGAWPSVLTVSAISAAAAFAVRERR